MSLTSNPKRSAIQQRSKSSASCKQPLSTVLPRDSENNRVRDRVRQWQAQGGGVVEADDVGPEDVLEEAEGTGCERSEPNKDLAQSRPRTHERLEARAEKRTPTKERRQTTEESNASAAKTKAVAVPTKRVVSDGHWRKKRSPPKSTSSPKIPDKRTPPRRPPASNERVCSMSDPRPTRRRKRERTSGPPNSVLDEVATGFASRDRSAEISVAKGILLGERPGSPAGEAPLESIAAPVLSTSYEDHTSIEGLGLERKHGEKDDPRSEKAKSLARVLGGSRKLFSKQTPEPSISTMDPAIEAWLDRTPDPFFDSKDAVTEKTIRPTSSRSDIQDTISERNPRDPNEIWDTLNTKEGTRRVVSSASRRRRVPSSAIYCDDPFPPDLDLMTRISDVDGDTPKLVDLAQPGSTRTSLKRTGARTSPSPLKLGRKRSTRGPADSSQPSLDGAARRQRGSSSSAKPSPCIDGGPPPIINAVEKLSPRRTRRSAASLVDSSEKDEGTLLTHMNLPKDSPAKPNLRSQNKYSGSRVTKHSDLISILSLPGDGGRSVRSARSIRTNRARLETATEEDLMQEFAVDESKYMREIQTLVDGVIPVLLSCVFSKTASAAAAGLFQSSTVTGEDPNFTKPIIDMGVALERLKTLHKRVPLTNLEALLTWAHGAQRVYAEYLKAWRLGFQDVVVNLAPAVKAPQHDVSHSDIDQGLPRDHNGDVVNGDGEKVDVAFLLKRPLVRLKYLAKTLKGISIVKPSTEASHLAVKFQDLVQDARLRANEERARLEDEAAANIDSTRSRDPRTLAPLSGVTIDRTRRVRARDYFNLALQHSSGQRVDCRVELLNREGGLGNDQEGDLLICEVDELGRWLLFPPIKKDMISARSGTTEGEIVVMIRGLCSDGDTWQELISLCNVDERIGFEWVQMLGLQPVPPLVKRSSSFASISRNEESPQAESIPVDRLGENRPTSDSASVQEVDIPIGERAPKFLNSDPNTPRTPPSTKQGSDLDVLYGERESETSTSYGEEANDLQRLPSQVRYKMGKVKSPPSRPSRSFKEALGLSGTSDRSDLRRTRAQRISQRSEKSPASSDTASRSRRGNNDQFPSKSGEGKLPCGDGGSSLEKSKSSLSPSKVHHRSHDRCPPSGAASCSAGSMDEGEDPARLIPEKCESRRPNLEGIKASDNDEPALPNLLGVATQPCAADDPQASLAERKFQSNLANRALGPKPLQSSVLEPGTPRLRRSSSPLKQEYDPSTASEEESDSDTSTVERKEISSLSDISDEDDIEDGDVPTPLVQVSGLARSLKPLIKPLSIPGTLKPSDSASQAPYKTVPAQPTKSAKTIASIYSWSDTGSWQSLHPDECSIAISPGLIEAFVMSASHSSGQSFAASTPAGDADGFADQASNITSQNDEVRGDRPLVALELTPLVPLRRGTALDISIRSPPTANSQINSGNNIMFRSRNPEECEGLYALINHARIHNPTYIALQNARGPFATVSPFSGGANQRTASRVASSRSSWFGGIGRSSSYRASSARTPSIAPSESSVASMRSAVAAFSRRLGRGGGGGMFNLALSTITSRNGVDSGTDSIYTSSEHSGGSGTRSPIAPGMVSNQDGSLGLKDAKIRLYERDTAFKWRDMGAARLTVLQPERNTTSPDGRPSSGGGIVPAVHEKRVLVHGKTKGEILLDAQLGENCFERVARTGIALSIWEDAIGPNGEVGVVGAVGGVAGGRAKVYMIQVRMPLGHIDSARVMA